LYLHWVRILAVPVRRSEVITPRVLVWPVVPNTL
jgi:hypothetical protein